jgi:hypothetical protein
MYVRVSSDTRVSPTGAHLPTQDDIGLNASGERAFVTPDADELLTESRELLRDVLPPLVRRKHEWASALVHVRTQVSRVMHALRLHAGVPSAYAGDEDIRVLVHEVYLSVAGVVGLLDDGAQSVGGHPLHTGRYVRVTVANAMQTLATMWLPAVPVFQLSPRLI